MPDSVLPDEDRIEQYTGELVAYTRARFPQRFYRSDEQWTLYTAAAVLRLADMADAVLAHMPARRDEDAVAALRSLYELVVTVTWVLIDPETRRHSWEGETYRHQLNLHEDLAAFGETLLTPQEVATSRSASVRLPPLTERATESDAHWSGRVRGLHSQGHLLSFRGLYISIYRLGSQQVHGAIASLLPYIERQRLRRVVEGPKPRPGTMPYALVSPLLAMALVVVASRVRWIDADEVRRINDEACRSGPIA